VSYAKNAEGKWSRKINVFVGHISVSIVASAVWTATFVIAATRENENKLK
jgi:hypothetical protein